MPKIFNHITSKLSQLDMMVVHAVPPGGNWKNIPESVPSQRISQIRKSYALGLGSRSTYYGRLLPEKPAYTINTYFNRPGNGCHIHYAQQRVLSQREAARLQSFPDSYVFLGGQGSINNQIGNAVPPLLAYQIAKQITSSIGTTGIFVDLFAGAGGLGMGFKWAGWQPVVANDIDAQFLKSYSRNIHNSTIAGSITESNIFEQVISIAEKAREDNPNLPLWILGGPPCQGFSTAGNKRTMEDDRNKLFLDYVALLKRLKPKGFVFENVAGLLSMEKGKVFERVKDEFSAIMPNLTGFVLNAENYAIPQRRKRVFLIGQQDNDAHISPPKQLTSMTDSQDLFFGILKPCVSVAEALSDLPVLCAGEDGSMMDYLSPPMNLYQKFLRGKLNADDYLKEISVNRDRNFL